METKLLLLLFFCHFLADFTHLSTSSMLDAKRFGTPLLPIFIHASMHGFLMLFVLNFFFLLGIIGIYILAKLWVFQVLTHFAIDVWKGKMNVWFPSLQNPANKGHWIVFGFDQFLHAVVIVLMVEWAF